MMKDYYASPDVRARMTEFLGSASLDKATCVYLTNGRDNATHQAFFPRSPGDLWNCLDEALDVSRSLWDRESLIADLDIEYVNFDFPNDSYLEPARIFEIQRPVEWAIERLLLNYGIAPLHLLSGRGHHFVWRIRKDSPAYERLSQLGTLSHPVTTSRLPTLFHRLIGESGDYQTVGPTSEAAFAGLGLVMEYLAHCVKQAAAPVCNIPVELTAISVGPGERGREMVSIDISEYGDPLYTRTIRIPFSVYLKPQNGCHRSGLSSADDIAPMFLIPLHELDVRQGIRLMRNATEVACLASRASVRIPDQSWPMERLVEVYASSDLAKFHNWFYSQAHDSPEVWHQTYDRLPMEVLPPCARYILERPKDLLLQPSGIERVVRVMLALGWHPRHIAGLIRSKYERDYGWGERWDVYHPGTRADFYTRMFAGLFISGPDQLIDFNCQSAKEAQFCFTPDCSHNLELFRRSLLGRKNHERLACRPFNRLFLPDKHL